VGSSLLLVSNPIIQFVAYEQISRFTRKFSQQQKNLVKQHLLSIACINSIECIYNFCNRSSC
jgi:nucleoside permease NupC